MSVLKKYFGGAATKLQHFSRPFYLFLHRSGTDTAPAPGTLTSSNNTVDTVSLGTALSGSVTTARTLASNPPYGLRKTETQYQTVIEANHRTASRRLTPRRLVPTRATAFGPYIQAIESVLNRVLLEIDSFADVGLVSLTVDSFGHSHVDIDVYDVDDEDYEILMTVKISLITTALPGFDPRYDTITINRRNYDDSGDNEKNTDDNKKDPGPGGDAASA